MRHNLNDRKITGIVPLDKPEGISSSGALVKVRKIYKAYKGGHTGALDPLASGLLPVCLGEAAKFSSFFLDGNKRYRATGILGVSTSTCDREGQTVKSCDPGDAIFKVEDILPKFKGAITQIPPVYSAIKVAGKELYKYARQGQSVEVPSRTVQILSLKLLNIDAGHNSFELEVLCSKGTYIRTLIADIGEALGVGAHVAALRRIEVEGLPQTMVSLEELESLRAKEQEDFAALDALLYPIDKAIALPAINLECDKAEPLSHGVRQKTGADLDGRFDEGALVKVYYKDNFMGVCRLQGGLIIPQRMMDCTPYFA